MACHITECIAAGKKMKRSGEMSSAVAMRGYGLLRTPLLPQVRELREGKSAPLYVSWGSSGDGKIRGCVGVSQISASDA
jgi:hypothetical protein